jgi:nucleotide-binding universal stress UspA family protein
MKQFQRIMVATDLSPTSEPAIREAIALAKENGAELLFAHAYEIPGVIGVHSVSAGFYAQWERDVRESVENRLQKLVERAAKEGLHAEPVVLAGQPYEEIAKAAKTREADLVVMGTHGRKGVARFFLGSVAARVISTAPCPVMTVHAA